MSQKVPYRNYKGILFSPNVQGNFEESTKLRTLHSFLDHLSSIQQNLNTVFFIDKESLHFRGPKARGIYFKQEVKLFEFRRDFHPIFSSGPQKAIHLGDLTYIDTKSGGSGGVIVVKDPSGKKWTLKS